MIVLASLCILVIIKWFSQNLISLHGDCRSLPTSGNVELDTRQVTSQFSSTMTGFLGEKNMNLVGKNLKVMQFVRSYFCTMKC